MLREGLAAEFPFAKRATDDVIAAARSAHVSRESAFWAAMSGFGASWAVGTIGQALATAVRLAGWRDPASWVSGAVTILGYALAIAIALRAGGRRALLWYFVLLAMQIGLQLVTALPGYLLFCERSGADCSPLRLAVRYVYLAAGIVVSVAVMRVIRSGTPRPNLFLNGAGLFTLLVSMTGIAYYLVEPRDVVVASAMDFTFNGGAALVTGVILCLRSRRFAPAVLLSGAMALGWLAFAGPFVFSAVKDGAGSQPASLYVSGLVQAVALLVGWLLSATAQRARTTAAA
jgi:hypothetical protein